MSLPEPTPFDLSGFQPPSPPRARWTPAALWAVGCGSGCVALVALQGLLAWLAVNLYFNAPPITGLRAEFHPPARATAGKTFPLTLTVRNDGKQDLHLENVTAQEKNLDGLTLASPTPRPSATSKMTDTTVWSYRRTLKPGETWSVRFEAETARAGRTAGFVEVGADWKTKRAPFRVTVEEAAKQ